MIGAVVIIVVIVVIAVRCARTVVASIWTELNKTLIISAGVIPIKVISYTSLLVISRTTVVIIIIVILVVVLARVAVASI